MTASRRICLSLALIAGFLVMPASVAGAPAIGDGDGGFKLTTVFAGKKPATDVAVRRGALFVATQRGRIRVVRRGRALARPFLSIARRVRVGAEEGLLSFAFHPRYGRNGLVYVYFTNRAGHDVLMEYRRDADQPLRLDPGSGRRVLRIRHPFIDRHNGGEIAFGPDGLLYLSTGDGSYLDERRRAQARGSLLGKLLRINPRRGRRYKSPKGNPFSGPTPGRDEIYSLGFRNPWRFSFDSRTGAISIGDVGESCAEEVDYRLRGRARGANFGWSRFEGTHLINPGVEAPGAIPPIFEYGHGPGSPCFPPAADHTGAAIVLGHVVRDRRLTEQYGRLIYADWVNGDIRTLIPAEDGAVDEQSSGVTVPNGATSFGQGPGRRLYVISTSGRVYRLDPA